MAGLTQLRREAERLRQKAGAPIPRSTLDGLGVAALKFVIEDARSTIRIRAEQKAAGDELEASILA